MFLLFEDEVENSESFQKYDLASTDSKYGLIHPDYLIVSGMELARLWGVSPKNIASLKRIHPDQFNPEGSVTLEDILNASEENIKNTSLPPEKKKEKADARRNRILDYDRSLGGTVAIAPYEVANEKELTLYDLALQRQNTGEIPSDVTIYHPYKRPVELVGMEHQKIYHPLWKEVGVFKGWHLDKGTNTTMGIFVEFPDAGLKKLMVNFSSENYSNSFKFANNVWGDYAQTSSAQRGRT